MRPGLLCRVVQTLVRDSEQIQNNFPAITSRALMGPSPSDISPCPAPLNRPQLGLQHGTPPHLKCRSATGLYVINTGFFDVAMFCWAATFKNTLGTKSATWVIG